MNLRTRLDRLELQSAPEKRYLFFFMIAGWSDDDITGATAGNVDYRRNEGESFEAFKQRIDVCPQRPPVVFARMIYREVSNDA